MFFSSCEYELCHEFIKICRKMDYSSKQVKVVEKVIVSSFSVSVKDLYLEMGSRVADTLYYIDEYTVVALNKIADRRKEDVALPIRSFCNFCIIDWKVAKNKGLPIGKVYFDMAYGVLTFANSYISNLLRDWKMCLFNVFFTNILLYMDHFWWNALRMHF